MPRGIAFEGNSSQLGHEIITVSQGLTDGRIAVSLGSWSSTGVYVSERSVLLCLTQRNNILMVFS